MSNLQTIFDLPRIFGLRGEFTLARGYRAVWDALEQELKRRAKLERLRLASDFNVVAIDCDPPTLGLPRDARVVIYLQQGRVSVSLRITVGTEDGQVLSEVMDALRVLPRLTPSPALATVNEGV